VVERGSGGSLRQGLGNYELVYPSEARSSAPVPVPSARW